MGISVSMARSGHGGTAAEGQGGGRGAGREASYRGAGKAAKGEREAAKWGRRKAVEGGGGRRTGVEDALGLRGQRGRVVDGEAHSRPTGSRKDSARVAERRQVQLLLPRDAHERRRAAAKARLVHRCRDGCRRALVAVKVITAADAFQAIVSFVLHSLTTAAVAVSLLTAVFAAVKRRRRRLRRAACRLGMCT